ncbi:HlyD family efflux transporter periplasmic adaptor subunit [Nitratidesulfovibrio sp.]|uniref:HlyD family secretion protein n=1 Tax=Nitratidesulfovibrio sp. TaxID=2802297 RepID=UPI003340E3AC
MKRPLLIVLVIAAAGILFAFARTAEGPQVESLPGTAAAISVEGRPAGWIVASGVVEPVTKELVLGFEMSGVVEEVMVAEGAVVDKGQPLARLRHEAELGQLDAARAQALVALAEYEKVTTGARPSEKSEALARVRRTRAVMEQMQHEAERRRRLVRQRTISAEEGERAWLDLRVAQEQHEEALQQYSLVADMFRREDIIKAEQQLAAANANVRVAEAVLRKTVLRAPVAGRVLRVHGEPGEVFSIFAPAPVISIGDVSSLNVRVEVDERDIGRVLLGQSAYVMADAFGSSRFQGKVTRIVLSLTPKRLRTGNPAEPVDRSVLEVLVTLDAPGPLLSGLRMDAHIDASAVPLPE